jgi:hypothetical protein
MVIGHECLDLETRLGPFGSATNQVRIRDFLDFQPVASQWPCFVVSKLGGLGANAIERDEERFGVCKVTPKVDSFGYFCKATGH